MQELTGLQTKVIEQLGYEEVNAECLESLKDIADHGADGGSSGFTYYSDTLSFFDKNKVEILAATQEMAEALGEDMLAMIASFVCLRDLKLTPTQVMAAIYEDTDDSIAVQNALSWFALEESARTITES